MRVLGIDFGDKNIGLAVSDPLQLTAQALDRYRVRSKKEDEKYFKNLVKRYDIKEIVVGLPLMMDGSRGHRAHRTQEFADWLSSCLDLPVTFWDERLTTKQALQLLRQQKAKPKERKEAKDRISAVIILSDYLESRRANSHDT